MGSLAIGYPTMASAPHSMVNGLKNLMAIAAETDITFPAAEKLKAYLADPSAFAAAAAPAAASAAAPAAAAKVEEPEEESEMTTWVLTSSVKSHLVLGWHCAANVLHSFNLNQRRRNTTCLRAFLI